MDNDLQAIFNRCRYGKHSMNHRNKLTMGAKITSFRKRRMERKIRDIGKMQAVVNVFQEASKSDPNKAGMQSNVSTSVVKPESSQGGVEEKEVSWRKYSKLRQTQTEGSHVEELKLTRKREQDRLNTDEILNDAVKTGNLVYENMMEEDVSFECHYCRLVTGEGTNLDCRVCGRLAHLSCLESRGFLDYENQKHTAYLAIKESPIGWSCPECEDVSLLLSADQMQYLMEKFDKYDTNGDGKFDFDDFLQQTQPTPTETYDPDTSEMLKTYLEYDRHPEENITWEEFRFLEALRTLQRSPQSFLVESLKPREIEKMKNCFRELDTFKTGVITQQASRRVLQTWGRAVGHTPKQAATWNRDTDFSLISWDRFIRENAFHIICARPNTVTIRDYLSSFDCM